MIDNEIKYDRTYITAIKSLDWFIGVQFEYSFIPAITVTFNFSFKYST